MQAVVYSFHQQLRQFGLLCNEHKLAVTLCLSLVLQLGILFLFKMAPPESKLTTVQTTIDLVDLKEASKIIPKPREVVKLKAQVPSEIPEEQQVALPRMQQKKTVFLPFYKVEALPAFKNRIMPIYPEEARKLGRQSRVLLEAYIDQEGRVQKIVVLKSGGAKFDQAATKALKNSLFKPAQMMGKPVAVKIRVPYVFDLKR